MIEMRSFVGEDGPILAMWDAACGRCHSCQQGLPGRCAGPIPPDTDPVRWHSRPVAHVVSDDALQSVAAAVWAIGLLIEWRELSPVVGLIGVSPSRPAVTAALQALSSSVERRADVVIALDGDLAAASLQVRRGGAIGAVCSPTTLPTYTAMVQRELEVLVPSDLLEAFALSDLDLVTEALRSGDRSHAS